jgi:predicted ribosomally synthesized peptide with SipW-like signal peptide
MTTLLNARVLLASGVIAAVAALALGATYAAWQATSSIEGNTIGTANLEIEAEGVSAYGSETKPITASNILPGWESDPAERAEITNNSSVALDLWFYVEPLASSTPAACDAMALAWRASTPGDGSNAMGYGDAYEGTEVGNIGDHSGVDTDTGAFSLVDNYTGVANAVKIADADDGFGPGQVIAIRQIAGFAEDAAYPTNSGSCEWTEVFVGTLPDTNPS